MTATVSKLGDAGQAFAYYSERDDYYMSDRAAAEWYGNGAGRLGLAGEIDPRDFHAVLQGQFRDAKVGTPARHTPGWDMTFSSPKSVSIAALVGKDERLTKAHDAAVRSALDHVQEHAIVTRQRAAGGGYEWRNTGNVVAGVVRHSTSRNLDPQLHSHCVLANVTQDPMTGKWVSIDSRAELYRCQREVGNVYMNALAEGVKRAGYGIEWRVDERGNASFEITDVPEAERKLFSSRRQEIEEHLRARGIEIENASGAARQAATLDTRAAKEGMDASALHAAWTKQAKSQGFAAVAKPATRKSPTPARRITAAADAVRQAIASITERQTRFTRRQLIQEATTYCQGRCSQKELGHAVVEAHEDGTLRDKSVQVRGYDAQLQQAAGFTTSAGVEIEAGMLRRAGALAGREPSLSVSADQVQALIEQREQATGYQFTAEQRKATEGILTGKGSLSVIQGYAGTAKTTSVLAAVSDAARQQNIRVRAIAPTHSAADTLAGAINGEAQTVAALNNRPLERGGRREVWIVDEAGMISATAMRKLLSRADQSGAQVVLTGDVRQIGSVGAGSAFQQTQDAHPDQTYQLTEIKRQSNEQLRAAVYDALHGDFSAALGKVEVSEQPERDTAVERIAARYQREVEQGKTTLVVTLSRADRGDVNAAIQQQRVRSGEVRDVQQVATLSSKQWTEAEQRDASRYAAGDVIESMRAYKNGPDRGELCTVESVAGGKVTARLQSGESWTFDPARITKYQVHERTETEIGIGDRIAAKGSITAADATEPDKSVRVKNGTSMTVESVAGGRITARLDDGRVAIIDARQGAKLDLDYCQTANQAQGRTVDSVIAYMRSSQTNLADRQHAYVAMSRARESAVIVTDSKEKLAATLAASSHGKEAAADQSDLQAAQSPKRPLSARAKEIAGDMRAAFQNRQDDRKAMKREQQNRKWEKKDRQWLRKAPKVAGKIEKRGKKIEHDIVRRTGVRMNAGAVGRFFESKQKREARKLVEQIRINNARAMKKVYDSLDRARERSVEREARKHGISHAEARQRIDERTLIDRHYRVEAAMARFANWVSGDGQPKPARKHKTGGTLLEQIERARQRLRAEREAKGPTRDSGNLSLLPDATSTPAAEPSRAPDHTPDRGRDDSHEIEL